MSQSSRLEKHLARIASCPKDYEWREISTLFAALGFKEIQGSGSRVAFRHPEFNDQVIKLHKPHGRNPLVIPVVYIRNTVEKLREWGYINE